MKYLFTGLSMAQSIVMTMFLLAFAGTVIYMVYRIARCGLAVAAETFDEYLKGKIEETICREEWQEMNQIIRDCQENGGWTQYGQ